MRGGGLTAQREERDENEERSKEKLSSQVEMREMEQDGEI